MDTTKIITIPSWWTQDDLQSRMFLPWGEVDTFLRLGYVIKEPFYRLNQIQLPNRKDRVLLRTAADRARARLLLIKRDGFYYYFVKGNRDVYGPALLSWCRLCGDPVMLGQSSIDHVIPRYKGGDDSFGNLWLTHELCNYYKGSSVHPRNNSR